jgi:hypothetical protein
LRPAEKLDVSRRWHNLHLSAFRPRSASTNRDQLRQTVTNEDIEARITSAWDLTIIGRSLT